MEPEKHGGQLVFVIDDEPTCLNYLASALEVLGFRTKAFSSASQALRAAESSRPAVVFSDFVLPDRGGIEILSAFRDMDPSIGRVLVTGHRVGPEIVEAHAAGEIGVALLKPFIIEAVEEALDALEPEGSRWIVSSFG